jgi:hypothetical protein
MKETLGRCEEFRRGMAKRCVRTQAQVMTAISEQKLAVVEAVSKQAVATMEFKILSSAASLRVERLTLTAQGEVNTAGMRALSAVVDCETEFLDKLRAAQARAIRSMEDAAVAARDSAISAIEDAAAITRDTAIARMNEDAKAHLKSIERARRSVVVVRLEPDAEDFQRSHRQQSQQNYREPVHRRRRSRSPVRSCSVSKSSRRCQ